MTSNRPPVRLAAELVRRYTLTADDLVIEVGSGDGSLLRAVRQLGPRVLGVEPDVTAVVRAWATGTDTVAAVFGTEVAGHVRSRYGPARVLLARSGGTVREDPNQFVAAASRCLAPGGVIVLDPERGDAVVEVRPGQLSGGSILRSHAA